jgi:hypothetical protein
MQENTGVFLGMCDNDKYAVFVVQNEKNEKFIAEIRDVKTGKYINEFTLDENQVVISNDAIVKLDGFGNWSNVFK